MAEIDIRDTATPWLRWMAATQPDYFRKALKSTGWRMQQEIKRGIRSKSPGGQKYKELIPAKIRRALEGARSGKRYSILGKLVNAVGYEYRGASKSVVIGWLSSSAVKLGSWMEKGVTPGVSQKMRQLFWMADVPISSKKTAIAIPARPTFDPMMRVLEPRIVGWMEDKILQYAANPPNFSSSSKGRKYRVKGA